MTKKEKMKGRRKGCQRTTQHRCVDAVVLLAYGDQHHHHHLITMYCLHPLRRHPLHQTLSPGNRRQRLQEHTQRSATGGPRGNKHSRAGSDQLTHLESLVPQAGPGGVLADTLRMSSHACVADAPLSKKTFQTGVVRAHQAELSGHTDSTDLPSANLTLSLLLTITLQRADRVVRLLSPHCHLTGIQNQSREISCSFS